MKDLAAGERLGRKFTCAPFIPHGRGLIRNDFLVKIDLKDAYLTVPIWENHRKFLRFQWGHETLEFSSLPFGVSVAPRIFTKLMKTPIGLLRRLGCRLIVYLDDILLMNQSAEGLKKDQDLTIHILTSLGFIINYKKSVLDPSHCQEFLGFRVNSQEMTLSLPQHKIKDIKNICQKCLNQTVVSVRQISEVIGKLSASARAIFPAPLHYRFLQMLKTKGLTPLQNYESVVTLDSESVVDRKHRALERKNDNSSFPRIHHRVGRERLGLGCSMPRGQNRGSLARSGDFSPHKRKRIVGSISGREIVFERKRKHSCPHKNGQHNNCSTYKETRRNCFQTMRLMWHSQYSDYVPYDELLRRNMNILYKLKRHITKGLYWTIMYCIHCLFYLVSLISNSHLVKFEIRKYYQRSIVQSEICPS